MQIYANASTNLIYQICYFIYGKCFGNLHVQLQLSAIAHKWELHFNIT